MGFYSLRLKPFEKTDLTRPLEILLRIYFDRWSFRTEWDLLGPVEHSVRWPEVKRQPEFREGLWKETCYEIFMGLPTSPSYWEWNFSPSHDYAAFGFGNYRAKLSNSQKSFKPRMDWSGVSLSAEFMKSDLEEIGLRGNAFDVQCSAVLLHNDGTKSYWALNQSGLNQPDFHVRENFVPISI